MTNACDYVRKRHVASRVTVAFTSSLDTMDSDTDMDLDAVPPFASKGKEKAVEFSAPSDGDILPWYVVRRVFGSHLYTPSAQGREIPTSHA